MRPYYQIPLQSRQLIEKQKHPLRSIGDAIREYIHLILKTHLTEYRYDYQFGCYVWDQDFENILSISKWESEMEKQIKLCICKFEKRLEQIQIKVKVEEPEIEDINSMIANRFKRRINILVSGEIWKLKQQFKCNEFIYFSPMSIM